MKETFVPKQTEAVVQFVERYVTEHGYSPTVREIAAAVGLNSPGAIQAALQQMIRLGILIGEPRIPRTIRVGHMPLRTETEAL